MTGVGLWQKMFDGNVSQSFFSRLPDLLLAHRALVLVLPARCCRGWWRLFFARFLNQGSRKMAERKGQLAGPCPECSDWVNNLTAPLVAGGLRRKAAGDLLVTHLFVSGLWYVWSGGPSGWWPRGGSLAAHVGCMRKGLYTFTNAFPQSEVVCPIPSYYKLAESVEMLAVISGDGVISYEPMASHEHQLQRLTASDHVHALTTIQTAGKPLDLVALVRDYDSDSGILFLGEYTCTLSAACLT